MVKSQVIYKDYSKDAERTALVSGENLAHMFSKIARWYTDISWVGHTHTEANITDFGTYAGSSTKGGAATSANKLNIGASDIGSETKPVYFNATTGKPVACAYSLNASVPANAVFTDINVKQSPSTANESREVLFAGNTGNTETTGTVGKSNKLYFNPNTGALTATSFSGSVDASNLTGSIDAGRLPTTSVTAGSYGPAAGGTLSHGGTFDVGYVTVDKYGRLTAASTKTFTLPAQYVHPTYTSKTSGLYKITVDGTGHVSGTAAVTASDLPAHSHTLSLAADTGTSSITLSANTKYKLTAGGSTYIFTTPADTNTTYSAGTGLALDGTTFNLYMPRVTKDCNEALPGMHKVKFEEFSNTSTNTPSAHWYHIIEMEGDDDRYATQLALGMTTTRLFYRNYSSSAWSAWKEISFSDHTHNYIPNTAVGLSAAITLLDTGNSIPVDDCYYITQTNDATNNIYYRRKHSILWSYIKGKADSVYAPISHTHKYAGSSSAGGAALAVLTNGDDVKLGTASSSSNDSGDIVFLYGDGSEKSRFWMANEYTAKAAPYYRVYSASGTQLYNGCLVLGDGTGASGSWNITAASATTASKLSTNAGGQIDPVYFSNGVPVKCKTVGDDGYFTNVAIIGSDGVMEIGKYIDMHLSNGSSNDYDYRLTNTSTSSIEFTSRAANNTLKLYAPSGYTNIQFQTAESNKAYTATGIKVYPLTTSGSTMTIDVGGNMVIGGGEAASTLYDNDFDGCKTNERENLYLGADGSILFVANVQNYANRTYIVWENLGCLRPSSNNSLSLGRSEYYWNKAYVTQTIGGSGGTWISARDRAVVKQSSIATNSSYHPVISSKTTSGEWSIGALAPSDEKLYFSYTTDSDYNSGTNNHKACSLTADGAFSGSAAKWTTARTLTIGSTGKSVDGSGNVSWSLSEIGAAAASHSHSYIPLSGSSAITGQLSVSTDNCFRACCGGYGVILRNDGSHFYFLLTDKKKKKNKKTGNNWNSLRPIFFNCSTGRVNMENGLSVTAGGITATAISISNPNYGPLEIVRTGNKYAAGIKFYNQASGSSTNILLGSIAMESEPNGGLLRYHTNGSTKYTILDTGNSSVSRSLTSGTKIATITIAGTATDLYCQTNTNTTYTFATGDSNGQIKVTPSGGSAQNVSVKGLGSAAYTASSDYAPASHSHDFITRNETITFGASRLQWFDLSGNGTVSATTPYNPGNDWFHHIMLNHGNGNGYYVDLAICFHSDLFYYKRISAGKIANADRNNGWVRIIDSSCIGSQSVASAGKWTTARTLTLTGSVTGSASIDGSGNVSLATTTNHTHSYLPLAGGTMTGDITFTAVTSTSYPATSCKLYWTGSTDWAKIYYRVDSSDAGRLVLDLGDDTNTRIDFAYNGTTKSYIDTSGNFSGNAATATTATNATYTNHLNIVATNEIRFNASTKPSSAMDLYIGYVWSDGNGDAKINSYIFQNGNRTLTKIQAASIILGSSSNQGTITLYNNNNKSFSLVASPDATAGGGITLPPTSGLMTDIVYKASSGTYGALGKVENTGCIASLTAEGISSHQSRASSTQSFGGTYTLSGGGWSDGGSYGFYLRNSLTSSSSLVYNQQYGSNSWRGEATIVDSKNIGSHIYTILWSGSTSCTARSSTSITLTTAISANKYRFIKVVWNCGTYTGTSEFRADTLNVTNNIPSGSDATTTNMIQFKIASDGKSVSVGPGTTTITVIQIAGVYPL